MIATLTMFTLGLAAAGPNPDYGRPPPPKPVQVPAQGAETGPKLNLSKAARKAIMELQTAVNANDTANIPAKLAAAQAVANTPDDKYVVAQLQLKAAAAANNEAALVPAIEAMLATGRVEAAQAQALNVALGKIHHKNRQYPQAAAAFERVLAANAANTDALILLAETRNAQGQVNDSIGLIQRAIVARSASGQKADESWYKRMVGLAYEAKLPSAIELSRQWVAAYPTAANWRDALRVYRQAGNPDDALRLDALRLARATGGLEGDADFHMLAYTASESSLPGEARAVIDEAIAAKQIDPNKPLFKNIVATLNTNKAMGRAGLADLAKEALAAPTAKLAVKTADAYYGYGEYAEAAELYRAALGKSGADADMINLHLGMALARAGDKAGATAALNAVGGRYSDLAKYWLVYVATRP